MGELTPSISNYAACRHNGRENAGLTIQCYIQFDKQAKIVNENCNNIL